MLGFTNDFQNNVLSKYVLEMSDGIDNPIGLNYKLVASLFVCWALAFLCLCKGFNNYPLNCI